MHTYHVIAYFCLLTLFFFFMKKFYSACLLLGLILCYSTAYAQFGQIFKIRNRVTGYILEIPANPNADALYAEGAQCTERSDNNTANQHWYIRSTSYTYPTFNIVNRNSNKALGTYLPPPQSPFATDANVVQNTLGKGYSQEWIFSQVNDANGNPLTDNKGNYVYQILSVQSGRLLVPTSVAQYAPLKVEDGSMTNDPLTQWIKEDISGDYAGSSGTFQLSNVNSGLALQVVDKSGEPGARIEQGKYISIASQQWELRNYYNGYQAPNNAYAIVNRLSGLALQVVGQSLADTAPVEQGQYIGIASQHWYVNNEGSNSYTIRNVNSGYVLQVIGASTSPGAQMQQGGRVPVASQLWQMTFISQFRVAGNSTTLANSPATATPTDFTLHPNPATTYITLTLPNTTINSSQVTVVDAQGRTVNSVSYQGNGQLDISRLAAGIYIVHVADGSKRYSQKFVKQ